MNKIHSVCVYSASSTQIDPVYFEAAQELGRLLAKEEIRLVNGAGSIGLMRSVADAVLSAGRVQNQARCHRLAATRASSMPRSK